MARMNLLKRLFARDADPKPALRPLWHRTVELSRDPAWYARHGVADTVQGRFDMITLVLGMVILRMEREERLKPGSVYLTELFVDDMDGQLRETGMGDPTLGKQMGRLVSVLGGRIGALRAAGRSEEAVAEVIVRNAAIEGDGRAAAAALLAFAANLERADAEAVLAGNVAL
jgi:cytochrome b pre-mRNA-processing protein 3